MSRILWHGCAPWMGTGYGQQSALTIRRLRDAGHHVIVSGYAGVGSPTEWEGIEVFPGDHEYGKVMLIPYIERFQPDLTLSLLDPWVLNPIAKRIAKHRFAAWTPVDHEPLAHPNLTAFFEHSKALPIAMSRFGERVMRDADLDPVYVPHGIDTQVFQPGDRAAARNMLAIPEDAFVIGMVATNTDAVQPRKGWVEALRAFAEFRRGHPEALMYLHTQLNPGDGLNLPMVADRLGLGPEAFISTGQLDYLISGGIAPETVAAMHNSFDVLLSPSYGEGFGLAPLEAQACGVPVIVSDASAQIELCGAGWLVETEPEWVNAYLAWWRRPQVASIVDALEQAYAADRVALGMQARDFALRYDADKVFAEHWLPALDDLLPAQDTQERLNRAQRRALAKA